MDSNIAIKNESANIKIKIINKRVTIKLKMVRVIITDNN